nr:AMP-binding protein [Leucobacter luti]
MKLSPSAHVDTFARDALPPFDTWPTFEFTLPELNYPDRLNAAEALIDAAVERFGPDRPALLVPDGEPWSYGELQRRADQFARVLTDAHGIVPGNRVVLRMLNSPWTVACWLGILKAGAVVVTTMTAWKAHEFGNVAERVRPTLMVIDHDALADVAPVVTRHRAEGEQSSWRAVPTTNSAPRATRSPLGSPPSRPRQTTSPCSAPPPAPRAPQRSPCTFTATFWRTPTRSQRT